MPDAEDGQLTGATPKVDPSTRKKDKVQIVALPPNDDTTFMPRSEFPGT